MRFLVDAQLPPKLAVALRNLGYTAEHVEEVGLRHAKDSEIWEFAQAHQAAVITKDEDFVDRFRRRGQGPVIVWLRVGNAVNSVLLGWLIPLWPAVTERIRAGDRLIEVR